MICAKLTQQTVAAFLTHSNETVVNYFEVDQLDTVHELAGKGSGLVTLRVEFVRCHVNEDGQYEEGEVIDTYWDSESLKKGIEDVKGITEVDAHRADAIGPFPVTRFPSVFEDLKPEEPPVVPPGVPLQTEMPHEVPRMGGGDFHDTL